MDSFASVEAAGQAVTDIIAAGIIPAGLEMMDRRAVQMVEPFVKAGYDMAAQRSEEHTSELQSLMRISYAVFCLKKKKKKRKTLLTILLYKELYTANTFITRN